MLEHEPRRRAMYAVVDAIGGAAFGTQFIYCDYCVIVNYNAARTYGFCCERERSFFGIKTEAHLIRCLFRCERPPE
jgi:hypothetical protein